MLLKMYPSLSNVRLITHTYTHPINEQPHPPCEEIKSSIRRMETASIEFLTT